MSQDLYECQLRTPRELYIQKFKKVLVYQSWLLVLIYGPCNQRVVCVKVSV